MPRSLRLVGLLSAAMLGAGPAAKPQVVPPAGDANDGVTATPIKHVIVVVGENRTFDHLFATYQPGGGQVVWNLLSRGIINEDGSPGPHFQQVLQQQGRPDAGAGYQLSPAKAPYQTLPPPLAGGPKTSYVLSLQDAAQQETALDAQDLPLLLSGGTGLDLGVVDTRIANVDALPPGPFPLTPSLKYDDYTQSPVHRFYQMWQELDCSKAHATPANPSGCLGDLFAWVETSVGSGSSGARPPTPFDDLSTKEGASALGFYNVAHGDAPYLKELADQYAMSDNFHQSVMGGTGANHIMLGTGDALWFSDGKGHAAVPPALETENPNPQPGTANYYTQDGGMGGSYSACADAAAPGAGAVTRYLGDLGVAPRCEAGHYYLLNNYSPGYNGDGTVNGATFVIPPSTVRTIGDALSERQVSWRYYGDQWNRFVKDNPPGTVANDNYCDICNPFLYATSIMTDADSRTTHLKDTDDLDADIAKGWLPAFAIVKPSSLVDGHPASSKLDLFEAFTRKLVDAIKAQPALWQETAIIVTFDEGGGYYDSGYVQPLDFFGDGTRIPTFVVSPFAKPGYISHHYADHVSILKFVEANWGLAPLTARSRDNLPNPVALPENPWVPRNGPAIDDLMDLFAFPPPHRRAASLAPLPLPLAGDGDRVLPIIAVACASVQDTADTFDCGAANAVKAGAVTLPEGLDAASRAALVQQAYLALSAAAVQACGGADVCRGAYGAIDQCLAVAQSQAFNGMGSFVGQADTLADAEARARQSCELHIGVSHAACKTVIAQCPSGAGES